ncbi:succinylglutamate desuccinylase/aspartoacylase family protein [Mesorhizobium sp. M0859]|uniref:succinylglutamate desuccinylase/aspartoacylase family protein n=1 Tax=Mesorhizobium sp. M0859 TaxID=2957014 RepID=UPI00333DB585
MNSNSPGRQSKIWMDLDLDAERKQVGFFRLPLAVHDRSGDDAGYNYEPIPFITIRNGDGPGVLLMAGNHGNEYEGQIILMKLVQELQVDDVCGRIIVLPAANAPAVRADRRNSPLDDGNLNRQFPGAPDGGPTAMIAHLIESALLTRVDYAVDLHSGSLSAEYLPCAVVARPPESARIDDALDRLRVFGMPIGMFIEHSTGGDHALIGACRRQGVHHLSTELGGGGSVSREALRIAEHGLRRLLHHVGVLRRPLTAQPPQECRVLRRVPASDYIYADSSERGLFEPLVGLGDEVAAGQTVGLIHFTTTPWREPESVTAKVGGVVLCRRVPARTGRGDCVFVIGRDWTSPLATAVSDR